MTMKCSQIFSFTYFIFAEIFHAVDTTFTEVYYLLLYNIFNQYQETNNRNLQRSFTRNTKQGNTFYRANRVSSVSVKRALNRTIHT